MYDRSQIFLDKIQNIRFLYQNVKQNLQDLILTNDESMVNNLQYVPPLRKGDHVCLDFNTNLIETGILKDFVYEMCIFT